MARKPVEPEGGYAGAPSAEPETEGATLIRIRTPTLQEREDQHLALLLWAASDADRRSWSAISRATGTPVRTLRGWHGRLAWAARAARHGDGAAIERDAARIIRETYLPEHRSAVNAMQTFVRASVWTIIGPGADVDAPQDARPPDVPQGLVDAPDTDDRATANRQDAAARARAARLHKAKAEAEAHERAQQAHLEAVRLRQKAAEEERQKVETFYRRSLQIVEACVATVGKQLADSQKPDGEPVNIRPQDLPKLLAMHKELAEAIGAVQPAVTSTGHASLEPSYRVQLASNSGGDVLQAMLDDVAEVQAVLTALRDRRGVGIPVVTPEAPDLVVVADDG